jgi:hypothetical protein
MTEPNSDRPEPVEYQTPAYRTGMQRIYLFSTGLVATGFAIFVAVCFGGMSSFEQQRVWWALPLAAAVAIACAVFAWSVRRRFPPMAAGAWTGVVIGVLLAGLCFSSM